MGAICDDNSGSSELISLCDTGSMKHPTSIAAALVVAVSHAVVHADVTVTMTNSIDGPMAGLIAAKVPSITMRVQGLKARTDIDGMGPTVATIMDVADKQMFMLDQTAKTLQRVPLVAIGQPSAATAGGINQTAPPMNMTAERTGRTAQMAGETCEEVHLTVTMDMSQVGLASPDVPDVLKGLRMAMTGSTWISTSSPGAREFIRFQEAARASGMVMPTDLFGGQNTPNPIAQTASSLEGLTCLSEIQVTYEGTGPMIEMLKKMGTMKVTSRLTAVSLDPIQADLFVVPDGYQETPFQNPLIRRQ